MLDREDRFWADVTRAIFEHQTVRSALRAHLTRNFAADRDRYVNLTRQIPELADAIAAVLTSVDTSTATIPDEVLRRMREPVPAAQRALLARALDDRNPRSGELADRIIAEPSIAAGVRHEILQSISAGSDRAQDLAFRYAVAIGQDVPPEAVRRAILRRVPALQHAALAHLDRMSDAELTGFTDALTERVASEPDGRYWGAALRLLFRIRPEASRAALVANRSAIGAWSGEAGLDAFVELSEEPSLLREFAAQVDGSVQREIVRARDCRTLPGALALETLDARGRQAAQVVLDYLVRLGAPDATRGCDPVRLSKVLDNSMMAAEAELAGRDIARLFERIALAPQRQSVAADGPEVQALAAILRRADRTRTALSADADLVRELTFRRSGDMHPLAAALVLALPHDHPVLHSLRAALRAGPSESLSDRVRSEARMYARVLSLTARERGWEADELDLVAAVAAEDTAADASRAAFNALMTSGSAPHLIALFDRFAQGPVIPGGSPSESALRALRAFARATQASRDLAPLYTPSRIGWILGHLPDAGLRGFVIRAFENRPADLLIDPRTLDPMLARAAATRGGTDTTRACVDAATLGPFTDAGPGFRLLESSALQDYEGENWLLACMRWLAPSSGARLNAHGLLLAAVASGNAVDDIPPDRVTASLTALAELWAATTERELGPQLRRRFADLAAGLAPRAGWGAADISVLRSWDARLSPEHRDQAWTVRWEWLQRGALIIAAAIPAGLAVHLGVWGALMAAYPHSLRIQTHIFFNPWIRKIFGLGYVDLILTWLGPVRRRFFAPFRESLLGDIDRTAPGGPVAPYYPRSEVAALKRLDLERSIRDAERDAISGVNSNTSGAVVTALAAWRGPTCLFGPSGRGKSSYLRHVLGTGQAARFPFVYLRAAECGTDVLGAVCGRLGALGRDRDLVASLVHAGLFDVYVDGLNEVEREAQEAIVRFIVDNRSANLFLASQEVSVSLPSKLAVYYLLPLTRDQMKEFLAGREATIDISAPIRGGDFLAKASAFIDNLAAEAAPQLDQTQADPEIARRRELASSFLATLANPMDLDTAALLLCLDIEPDPLRLQQQQFQLVAQDHQKLLGRPFPKERFSRAVVDARRTGTAEIDHERFPEVVAILEERKQVRRASISLPGGRSTTAYLFRHDKIRDFYSHFALLGDDPTERFELARDDRFAGVFDYLARDLPPDAAAEMKEHLLSAALDANDHRLSDRFLQHLRWRSLLDRADPGWIAEFDLLEGRQALERFHELSHQRERIEVGMRDARTAVESARSAARVLCARDAAGLERALGELFAAMGGTEELTEGGLEPVFRPPQGEAFALLCVAGARSLSGVARIGVEARSRRLMRRKLLVVNPDPDAHPSERDWASLESWCEGLKVENLVAVGTLRVYELAVREGRQQQAMAFWDGLLRHPPLRRSP